MQLDELLHETSTIDDPLWSEVSGMFEDEQILELVMLVGFYHMVSFIVNAARLPLEPYGARFPSPMQSRKP